MANSISVSISQVSQNVASNSSVIRVSLTAYFQYYASSGQTSTAYCTIDGNNFSFTAPTYNVGNGGSVHLGTFDRTITHNADGTRAVYVAAEWYPPYVYPSGISFIGSNSIGITTIPRASSFSISGNTMGSGMTINISRASSGFTHLVRYQFGSITRDYGNQGTSCGFTPPLSDASQIPNATSGSGRITVYTYSGGTHIGTTSAGFTLYLPSSVVPSFSSLNISRVDNGIPSSWGIYVQGISKAALSIGGASGIYGSSISAYSIRGGGYSTGSSSFTTGILGAGNITFTGAITDSRGRSVSKSVNITVHANYIPSLTLRAERCNSSGTANNAGTYIKITPTYSCASINGKNAIASKRFAIAGTSYTNTTGASGASFILGNNDILVSRSYTVTGKVVDSLGQSTGNISVTVSSEEIPFNLCKDGVGFGKYCEKSNAIDSAWDMYVKGDKLIPFVKKNNYWGISEITDYLRTPPLGLLPYASDFGSDLGTPNWRFRNMFLTGLDVANINVTGHANINQLDVTGYIELRAVQPYIDFHANNSTTDFTSRLMGMTDGSIFAYTSIINASDERLKKEQECLDTRYLDLIDLLSPKTYRFKKNDSSLYLGLIAQEVMEGLNNCKIENSPIVSYSKDIDQYGIDYAQIGTLAIYGVQQLNKLLAEQNLEIKSLEKRIEKLEALSK